MNEIVVGVDRSDTARRAAERAAQVANAMNSPLHIVTCGKPTAPIDVGSGSDVYHADWVSESEQFLKILAAQLGVKDVTTHVADGDPAKALCAEADRLGAQMIVVGNKRVHGAARVLGSVAGSVTKAAHCDVLVVNTTH